MRRIPSDKYLGLPCSYVGTGCAYERLTGEDFNKPLPEGLKKGGWLPLRDENRYIRSLLSVRKQVYYKRGTRPKLKDFLETNKEPCAVCVYGHFIYVEGGDYWSFFDNDNDEIVSIWYFKRQ